jgi:hypothetical protein
VSIHIGRAFPRSAGRCAIGRAFPNPVYERHCAARRLQFDTCHGNSSSATCPACREGARGPRPASVRRRAVPSPLWHLNRRSAAGGVAVGMFCGLIPGPLQMLGAGIAAVLFRVNLPTALLTTLYTNPLTIVPLYLVAYKIGSLALGAGGGPPPAPPPNGSGRRRWRRSRRSANGRWDSARRWRLACSCSHACWRRDQLRRRAGAVEHPPAPRLDGAAAAAARGVTPTSGRWRIAAPFIVAASLVYSSTSARCARRRPWRGLVRRPAAGRAAGVDQARRAGTRWCLRARAQRSDLLGAARPVGAGDGGHGSNPSACCWQSALLLAVFGLLCILLGALNGRRE